MELSDFDNHLTGCIGNIWVKGSNKGSNRCHETNVKPCFMWLHHRGTAALLRYFVGQSHHRGTNTDTILGILPAVHPAEDQLQAVHQEPAVHHPEDQSQPMPVLPTQEVYGRGHEPRWWVLNWLPTSGLERQANIIPFWENISTEYF